MWILLCVLCISVKYQLVTKFKLWIINIIFRAKNRPLEINQAYFFPAQFGGQWYEASRSPASQWSCVGLDIYTNASGIYLNLTTPEASNVLYLNHTSTYQLTPVGMSNSSNSSSSINVTSTAGGYTYPTSNNGNVTIKILEADSSSYAVLCGYSSTSNSSFGIVITRQRLVTNATLTSYVGQVNSTYAGFANLTNVNQGPA